MATSKSNVTEMTREQEQEHNALSEIREAAAQNQRPMNLGLVSWLASRAALFASNVRGDLVSSPERHPDVIVLKRLMPQSSLDLHVRMAWLCWRARQVRFFHPARGSRTHVGSDVLTWEEALGSANQRDSTCDEAFEARACYYADRRPIARAEREQQREQEEEAVALTLMRLPTRGRGPAVDVVPTVPPTVGDGKALQQQEISAAKEQERTEEKQLQNLRDSKPVNAGVKVRKNQNQNQK